MPFEYNYANHSTLEQQNPFALEKEKTVVTYET
ncbi:MAG: hypothetical protein K0Q77_1380 [Anaerosporomusa subterranea]|jgi:hypothetical protein|nr:hypothetical protein [Anaerosporomusa subterranea]